jgi:serine/threonine-protein kinase
MSSVLLDRYELVDHLASGGMGELFVARRVGDAGFERLVVVKRLRADLADDERHAMMLIDEARIAATLYHRNLVQVHDVGIDAGQVVLVLEYVPGVNLASLLDAIAPAPLPYDHALAIVIEIARGLHYAHERDDDDGQPLAIVHRDVSLPNVLIGDHGDVKLTDFGVAKARSRMYTTRSKSIKGKLGYMAPEQIRGQPVDRRTDVFGLGVVLFEATTGVPLYTAESEYETMRRVLDGEVADPRSVRDGYPHALAVVVGTAIARDPDHRYTSAGEMAAALVAVADGAGWTLSSRRLGRYVRDHVPAGERPWLRREPVVRPWSERTTLAMRTSDG